MLADVGVFVRWHVLAVILLITLPIVVPAADEAMPPSDYATARIRLTSAGSVTPVDFTVRLAVTPTQHSYGLMFSPPLPPRTGMLFLFNDAQPRTFWMKNTPIELDLLFFDSSGTLVTLISNTVPFSLTFLHSRLAAKYVLEIGGGEAARLGLKVGARLQLPINVTGDMFSSRKKVK